MTKYSKLTIPVLIISALFISCKNDVTDNSSSVIKIKKFGYYHNQALKMILNDNNIDINKLNFSGLKNVIIEKLNKKYPDKFNNNDFTNNNKLMENGFIRSEIINNNEPPKMNKGTIKHIPVGTYNYQSIFNYMKNNNYISNKFYKRLVLLYQNQDVWFSQNDPVVYAENKLSIKTLPNSDKKYARAFISILNGSNQFWSKKININKTNLPTTQSKGCGLAIAGADGLGGLYGMLGGPAWSIIEGTIFSGFAVLNCE